MPGVHTEDIEVSVESGTLTISGRRGGDELPENARPHRRERNFGEFSRSIQLPFAVDTEQIEASFKDGILNIALPRVEADKPKKIAIKS
jgi:HSP20 family protein